MGQREKKREKEEKRRDDLRVFCLAPKAGAMVLFAFNHGALKSQSTKLYVYEVEFIDKVETFDFVTEPSGDWSTKEARNTS